MKKFAILTAFLAGVSADGGAQCTDKVLDAKSTFTLSDGVARDGACYEVRIGASSWKVLYKKSDPACTAAAYIAADSNGDCTFISGDFDAEGAPVPATEIKNLADGSAVTVDAVGPQDIVQGLAEKFTCKDCANREGYTGAEELIDGQCTLTAAGVDAYIADLDAQLLAAEANAVSDDLDAIKDALNQVLDPQGVDAQDAADKAKSSIESLNGQLTALQSAKDAVDASLSAALNDGTIKQGTIDDLNGQLTALQSAKDSVDASLSAALNEGTIKQGTIDDLNGQLTALQSAKDSVDASLSAALNEGTIKQGTIDDLNGQLTALQSAKDSVDASLSALQQNFDALEFQKNSIQGERDHLNGRIDNVKSKLSDFTGETAEARAEQADALHTEMTSLKSYVTTFSMQLHSSAGGGSRSQADVTDADGDGNRIDQLIQKLGQDYDALSTHATSTKDNFDNFKKNAVGMAAEYRSLTAGCDSWGAE